jgi:hypothetical protein
VKFLAAARSYWTKMKVSKVAEADLEKGLSAEDVKLMKIQFSSCRFPTLCISPGFTYFQP